MRNFDNVVRSIRRAYTRIGHKHGWRFLLGPKKAFHRNTRLFFIGVNPGGRHGGRGSSSVERGNAYRVESWVGGKLQPQVSKFYNTLAARLKIDRDDLMDETLVSNLCPFRCARWHKMSAKKREESLVYSKELWTSVLRGMAPKVVVCIGDLPYRTFREIFEDLGFNGATKTRRTGWGKTNYSLTLMKRRKRKVLLVGLPHLSTFSIFGRTSTDSHFDPLWSAITSYLR